MAHAGSSRRRIPPLANRIYFTSADAGVAELVDAGDLKSPSLRGVRVRVSSLAELSVDVVWRITNANPQDKHLTFVAGPHVPEHSKISIDLSWHAIDRRSRSLTRYAQARSSAREYG